MAKEYIDREAAANIFSRARSAMRPEDYSTFDEMNTRDLMLLNAEQAIRLLPAADVVEVKHGRWIGTHDGFYYTYSCSECGYEALYEENTTDQVCSKHCPNCGVRMEGDGE